MALTPEQRARWAMLVKITREFSASEQYPGRRLMDDAIIDTAEHLAACEELLRDLRAAFVSSWGSESYDGSVSVSIRDMRSWQSRIDRLLEE